MIPVTKSYLPPIEKYHSLVKRIYDNVWLTNRGEFVNELEVNLKSYLDVEWLTLTNNGTIPLQIALKLLGNYGEVITTPFSYVATTSSIVWQGCKPVFVDIHPGYLTIDEEKIEKAITDKTTCILVAHVFGNPCNLERIAEIAEKYNIKVIYDAAHCFGVKYKGKSIFDFGDISTCSFHATKIFHTAEGGAMFANDFELRKKLFYSHNFGHNGPSDFYGVGINAKMSELHAAMGLCVLPEMENIIDERENIVKLYNENLDFSLLQSMKLRNGVTWNYSYYPVIFKSEKCLLNAFHRLKEMNIFPRRYFYPSLNTVNYVSKSDMPVSEDIAPRIACLPLYVGLDKKDVMRVCTILNQVNE